jgi:SHS2 domain-containing protein
MTGHWLEIDHTADIAIRVFGQDLETLFVTSAQALMELAFKPGHLRLKCQLPIQLSAPDVETLLIDWLNELLFLSEKHNLFFSCFRLNGLSPTGLSAVIDGMHSLVITQSIKAATFHNIAITETLEGFHTEIVFDT